MVGTYLMYPDTLIVASFVVQGPALHGLHVSFRDGSSSGRRRGDGDDDSGGSSARADGDGSLESGH